MQFCDTLAVWYPRAIEPFQWIVEVNRIDFRFTALIIGSYNGGKSREWPTAIEETAVC